MEKFHRLGRVYGKGGEAMRFNPLTEVLCIDTL